MIARLARAIRVTPALYRIAALEAIAYRAEIIVWTLAITMPFIMMALWYTVALEKPVGRYGPREFVVYFLATTIVRQLASSWTCWELNFAVRQGTLSPLLLRPVSVLWWYALQNIAALGFRSIMIIPFATLMIALAKEDMLSSDPQIWLLWIVAIVGAWLIAYFVSVAIGSLSLYMESSLKVMDVWLALYFIFSGYLMPVELFPPALKTLANVLPFRFQIGLPVELMTNHYTITQAFQMLGYQWLYVTAFGMLAWSLWRYGLKRYAAYGG